MPCSSSDRRCTLPDVDVTVSLPLNRRRRNLSEPQLHAVPTVAAAAAAAAGRRCVGSSVSSSSGAQCKMTSTDGSRTRLSPLSGTIQHSHTHTHTHTHTRNGKGELFYSTLSGQPALFAWNEYCVLMEPCYWLSSAGRRAFVDMDSDRLSAWSGPWT